MELITKTFNTASGPVEGLKAKWQGFNILIITGSKGGLACGVFDLDAFDRFNYPAAIPESSPDNPIGTLERFTARSIKRVNQKAQAMGITPGMAVMDALALIA